MRKLRKREGVLLKEHADAWAGKAKKIARDVRFERGFVAFADIDGSKSGTAKQLDALFEAAPLLESLELSLLSRAAPQVLFECPAVGAQVRELEIPSFGARGLVKQSGIALRSVSFRARRRSRQRTCDAGAKALASSPHAKSLLQLNLNNNKISPAGKKALEQSKHLSDARVLVYARFDHFFSVQLNIHLTPNLSCK